MKTLILNKITKINNDKKLFFYEDDKERYYSVNGKKIKKSISYYLNESFPVDWSYIQDLEWYQKMGLDFHLIIENHFNNKLTLEKDLHYKNNFCISNLLIKECEKMKKIYNLKEIITETPLEHKGIVGRLDLLGVNEDNEIILFDFKTSRTLLPRYKTQLSCYAYMLEKEYNIKVDKLVSIQVDKYVCDFNYYEQVCESDDIVEFTLDLF